MYFLVVCGSVVSDRVDRKCYTDSVNCACAVSVMAANSGEDEDEWTELLRQTSALLMRLVFVLLPANSDDMLYRPTFEMRTTGCARWSKRVGHCRIIDKISRNPDQIQKPRSSAEKTAVATI